MATQSETRWVVNEYATRGDTKRHVSPKPCRTQIRRPSRSVLGSLTLVGVCVWLGLGCQPQQLPSQNPTASHNASTAHPPSPSTPQTTTSLAIDHELSTASASPANANTAEQLLRQLVHTYRSARCYQDQADLEWETHAGDRSIRQTLSLTVQFRRPNCLRVQVQQQDNRIHLGSDGTHVWAQVYDAATADFDHQLARRPLPGRLTLADLYAVTEVIDPTNPGQAVSLLMSLPIHLRVSPLGLLLSERTADQILAGVSQIQQLDVAQWQGHTCQRLQVTAPEGPYVLWIDQQSKLLRQIQFPQHVIAAAAPDSERPIQVTTRLVVHRVELPDRLPDAAFQPSHTQTLRPMRCFVLPPGNPPPDSLGKTVDSFRFYALNGQPEDAASLRDRVVVLAWVQDHPTSHTVLRQLERTYGKWRDDARVAFRAVCVPTAAHDSVRVADQLSRQLQGARRESQGARRESPDPAELAEPIPFVQDRDATGRDRFGVTESPTVVVMSPDRRIQWISLGANPQIEAELEDVIQHLLAGGDLARQIRRQYDAHLEAYGQQLIAASWSAPPEQGAVAATQPAAASAPQRFRLQRLWSCDELTAPAGLVALPDAPEGAALTATAEDAAAERLVAIDLPRQLAALDGQGKVVRRVTLPDEDTGAAPITYLRGATDGQGQRFFAASTPRGSAVYVLDHQGQVVFRYPDVRQRHPGIEDVQLFDLDRDGQLELYVAFADVVGLHRVNLHGQREWVCRTVPGLISIAPPPRFILPYRLEVTHEQGTIVPVDASGQAGRALTIGRRTVHQLVATRSATPRPTAWLALAYTPEGSLTAVGLDERCEEQWSYGLPPGIYAAPVPRPLSVSLIQPDNYEWLLAGPDGSVHWIADDGSYFDHFNYGAPVHGLVGLRDSESGILVIASGSKIEAFRVLVK